MTTIETTTRDLFQELASYSDDTTKITIDNLGRRFIQEKRRLDELNEKLHDQQALVTQIEEVMYDMMQDAGVTKIGIEGSTLTPQKQFWANLKQDTNEGFEWLKRHELQDLIKMTVNSQTLSACVRQLMESGTILQRQNSLTGEPVYFDDQGQIRGISIAAKRKILARGIKP